MSIEIAMVISIVSVAFSVFFGLKSNKRSGDTEVADRTASITRLEVKIDMLTSNFADFSKEIKTELKSTNDEIAVLKLKMAEVESSAKSAHKRIDRIEAVAEDKK